MYTYPIDRPVHLACAFIVLHVIIPVSGGRHCETSGHVNVHMETDAPEPLFARAHSAQTGSVINELCVSRFNPSIIFLVTTLRRD